MTLSLIKPKATSLEEFDQRRAALVAEVEGLRRAIAEAQEASSELVMAGLVDGKPRTQELAALAKKISGALAVLPPRVAALEATTAARRNFARPVADEAYRRIAAERDGRHAVYLAHLRKTAEIVAALIAADATTAELEFADAADREAQLKSVDDGGLGLRPRETLNSGVLEVESQLGGLAEQIRYAISWNQR